MPTGFTDAVSVGSGPPRTPSPNSSEATGRKQGTDDALWVFPLQGVSPRSLEAVLHVSHFGSKIWKPQLEMTFSSSHNEVEQSHTWLSGFVGGLVPFAAAGKHHHQEAGLRPQALVWQEEPAGMVLQRQVVLDVHRAQ